MIWSYTCEIEDCWVLSLMNPSKLPVGNFVRGLKMNLSWQLIVGFHLCGRKFTLWYIRGYVLILFSRISSNAYLWCRYLCFSQFYWQKALRQEWMTFDKFLLDLKHNIVLTVKANSGTLIYTKSISSLSFLCFFILRAKLSLCP